MIATGGQGKGEELPEAEVIHRELVENGVAESRILIESQSKNTYENIRCSKLLLPETIRAGLIVSNGFHLFRAIKLAEDQGLEVAGLRAPTPLLSIPKTYFREYLAITKYFMTKR